MKLLIITLLSSIIFASCTEENRNRLFRSVQQNIIGERLLVTHYTHSGEKLEFIINDGKVTSAKTQSEAGFEFPLGYYYFYSEQGYVQLPIIGTVITELRD